MQTRRAINGRPLSFEALVFSLILSVFTLTSQSEGQELEYDFPFDRVGSPLVFPGNLSETEGTVFTTEFSLGSFIGDVVAWKISSAGMIQAGPDSVTGKLRHGYEFERELWRGSAKVPHHDQRIVFSGGRPFRWQYFSQAQKDMLSAVSMKGPDLVKWVRGDNSSEGDGPNDFRERSKEGSYNPIGAIVRSSVQRVGAPWEPIGSEKYADFRVNHKSRDAVLYVVSGTGMLHAFDADTGRELFAYVPMALIDKLPLLARQDYGGEFLLDGTPTIGDTLGGFPQCRELRCWRTILVGGSGGGRSSIYALDITNPAFANELRAANETFLWEFTSEDLGYAISRPVISRLSDGTGVVIFGNGLPRRKGDSGSLFILNAADGSLLQRLTLPGVAGNVGLLSVSARDSDQDGSVDAVYGGDSLGRLWKFDLSSLEYGGSTSATIDCGGLPLFSLKGASQSISAPPLLSTLPGGNTIVIFGTGKVFTDHDLTTDFSDGLYGIHDFGDCSLNQGEVPGGLPLTRHRLTENNEGTLRWIAPGSDGAGVSGWQIILTPGERIVNAPKLSNGRVVFTTFNPLVPGNENWLYGVDYVAGRTPDQPYLDINGDRIVNKDDISKSGIPVGRYIGTGLVSSVQVVDVVGGMDAHVYGHAPSDALMREKTIDKPDPGEEYLGTSPQQEFARGAIAETAIVAGSSLKSSRASWREVR